MHPNGEFYEKHISSERRRIYDFYKLEFDQNGCPHKNENGSLIFHPLLPAYLILEYAKAFTTSGNSLFIENAHSIASLALERAHGEADVLTFRYSCDDGLSYVPGNFYSALTQAWYVKSLSFLSQISLGHIDCDYSNEIKGFYNSLLVPIDQGGVLVAKDFGWIVEEYPHEPPLYTLNGWLTVLRWVCDSDSFLKKIGVDTSLFLNKNFEAVKKLLPLYDLEELSNTRYQLTGFTRVRFVFTKAIDFELCEFHVDIPGEGKYYNHDFGGNTSNRWKNHIERIDGRILQLNIVNSLVANPEVSTLNCVLRCSTESEASILVADGAYRPDCTAMPTQAWRELSRVSLHSGVNRLKASLSSDGKDLFAYPTNFKKKIDGKLYNSYHFIHIIDCAELYAFSGIEIFKEYAFKWLSYCENWVNLLCLQDPNISIQHQNYTPEQLKSYINKLCKYTKKQYENEV